MTKRIQAKHKVERRYGEALWGQESSPVHVRSYPPGQHGRNGTRKTTSYGQQFGAKQKLKAYYDMGEKQFRNTYKEAVRLKGDTGENLLALLESRLDAMIYRLKWAPTVFSARQIVNHGHVEVNGRKVNIRSYRVKVGDEISLRGAMQQNALIKDAVASTERDIPSYLSVESGRFLARFKERPEMSKIPYPVTMNVSAVIECYAR